jgi:hypothetical protein
MNSEITQCVFVLCNDDLPQHDDYKEFVYDHKGFPNAHSIQTIQRFEEYLLSDSKDLIELPFGIVRYIDCTHTNNIQEIYEELACYNHCVVIKYTKNSDTTIAYCKYIVAVKSPDGTHIVTSNRVQFINSVQLPSYDIHITKPKPTEFQLTDSKFFDINNKNIPYMSYSHTEKLIIGDHVYDVTATCVLKSCDEKEPSANKICSCIFRLKDNDVTVLSMDIVFAPGTDVANKKIEYQIDDRILIKFLRSIDSCAELENINNDLQKILERVSHIYAASTLVTDEDLIEKIAVLMV